jgi:hypothetical protein
MSPDLGRRFLQVLSYNQQATDEKAGPTPDELYASPLSDDLGHYRILRTSPLAAVPEVCCVDC